MAEAGRGRCLRGDLAQLEGSQLCLEVCLLLCLLLRFSRLLCCLPKQATKAASGKRSAPRSG